MEGGNEVSEANGITHSPERRTMKKSHAEMRRRGGCSQSNELALRLRRKPPKILRTRRVRPTRWIAAVSAAKKQRPAQNWILPID